MIYQNLVYTAAITISWYRPTTLRLEPDPEGLFMLFLYCLQHCVRVIVVDYLLGSTPTLSPALKWVAAEPTSSTTPENSWHSVIYSAPQFLNSPCIYTSVIHRKMWNSFSGDVVLDSFNNTVGDPPVYRYAFSSIT